MRVAFLTAVISASCFAQGSWRNCCTDSRWNAEAQSCEFTTRVPGFPPPHIQTVNTFADRFVRYCY